LETAVRVREVPSETAVTVAPGMTLPEGSETTPVMPPSVVCAIARGACKRAAVAVKNASAKKRIERIDDCLRYATAVAS